VTDFEIGKIKCELPFELYQLEELFLWKGSCGRKKCAWGKITWL